MTFGPGDRHRSRRAALVAAVSVALISTGSAYLAMVAFGRDVLAMNAGTAYATAGVFELSLVTVALLAREAAKDNRPGGVLLGLTWILSAASGAFAAWHELFIDHPIGAALFRFLVPLLAALMWHLALIGDRHLATGMSWSGMRQARRMHALFLSTEDLFRAQSFHDGSRGSRRQLLRAEAARRRARAIALRTVPPEEMRAQVAAWSDAMAAVGDGTADVARLHVDDRRRLTALLVDDGASTTHVEPARIESAEEPADVVDVVEEHPAIGASHDDDHDAFEAEQLGASFDQLTTPVNPEAFEVSNDPFEVAEESGSFERDSEPAFEAAPPKRTRRTTQKITPEQIIDIRAHRSQGRTVSETALIVGVSRGTVSKYAPRGATGSTPVVPAPQEAGARS